MILRARKPIVSSDKQTELEVSNRESAPARPVAAHLLAPPQLNLTEAFRFSLDALRANLFRTFLTALGPMIGNASVILVVTISLVGKDLILDQIRGIGSNLVYASYQANGQNTAQAQGDFVKLSDVRAIREQLGDQIVAAAPVMNTNTQIVVSGKIRDVTLDGVDENYAQVRNIVVLSGRGFDQSDVAVREHVAMLSEKLAVRMFSSLTAALGQTIRVNQLEFKVIGTFREKTSTMGEGEISDETILIPVTVMSYFLPAEKIDPVYIEVRNAADVPAVTKEVNDILTHRHRQGATYNVQNLQAILDTAQKIASVLTIVLVIVSAIALIISGIGIMNIMLVTVTERTREIGLRMAVGASRREVMMQFLVESLVISLSGGIVGIAIGLMLPLSVRFFTTAISVPISPLSILVAFMVSFTVGVGFGLLPARRASQLNPTEALRYE